MLSRLQPSCVHNPTEHEAIHQLVAMQEGIMFLLLLIPEWFTRTQRLALCAWLLCILDHSSLCLSTTVWVHIIIDVFRDVHNCTYNNGVKVKDTWYLVLEIFVQLRYICDYTQFVWKVPLYHITGIKYHGNCKMLFCYTKCLSKTKNAVKI